MSTELFSLRCRTDWLTERRLYFLSCFWHVRTTGGACTVICTVRCNDVLYAVLYPVLWPLQYLVICLILSQERQRIILVPCWWCQGWGGEASKNKVQDSLTTWRCSLVASLVSLSHYWPQLLPLPASLPASTSLSPTSVVITEYWQGWG